MSQVIARIETPMNLLPDMTDPEQAAAVNARMLSLPEYLDLARRVIGKFAPSSARSHMLRNEDAIAYVAHEIMMGDWGYKQGRSSPQTYRGYRARMAIFDYLYRLKKAVAFPDVPDDRADPSSPPPVDRDISSERRQRNVRVLRSALERLPREQQAYLIMNRMYGVSYAAIGRTVGLSHETINRKIKASLSLLEDQDDG